MAVERSTVHGMSYIGSPAPLLRTGDNTTPTRQFSPCTLLIIVDVCCHVFLHTVVGHG